MLPGRMYVYCIYIEKKSVLYSARGTKRDIKGADQRGGGSREEGNSLYEGVGRICRMGTNARKKV